MWKSATKVQQKVQSEKCKVKNFIVFCSNYIFALFFRLLIRTFAPEKKPFLIFSEMGGLK